MRLVSIKEFVMSNPAYSEGMIRYYIQRSKKYGLKDSIVRVGSRVFIDEDCFKREFKKKTK